MFQVLIFSQMTRMLDLIEDFCEIQQYDFCRLDGKTNIDDRRDSVSLPKVDMLLNIVERCLISFSK